MGCAGVSQLCHRSSENSVQAARLKAVAGVRLNSVVPTERPYISTARHRSVRRWGSKIQPRETINPGQFIVETRRCTPVLERQEISRSSVPERTQL